MKIRLGELRRLIARRLTEVGSHGAFPGQPVRNVLSPDINAREQLGALSAKAIDTVDDPDDLPNHLREPEVDPEDCLGPVPPDSEKPYVGQDPFARQTSAQPFSGAGAIRRG